MPEIPMYQERSETTTQTPVRSVSSAPAQALGRAVSGIGDEMFKQSTEYFEKMNAEESEAQVAQYYADRKVRSNAIQTTLKNESDPDTINESYEQWRKDEDEIFTNTKLNKNARNAIGINNEMFYADNDIGANKSYNTARIGKMDNTYVDLESMALNGESHTLDDGTVLSPKELYDYAQQKRVTLGTVDYDEYKDNQRDFDQNLEYKRIVSIADNDVDAASQMLKESNLTGEKLVLANDSVRDARELQSKRITQAQTSSTNDINKELQAKRLSRSQLEKESNKTVNVMGKEVPVVPPYVINSYKAQLEASEDYDRAIGAKAFKNFDGYVKQVNNSAGRDFGQKETDKLYTEITKMARGGASKASVESMLNIANSATTQYGEGSGWSEDAISLVNDLTDTYTTLYTDFPTKYKAADPIGALTLQLDSLIKEIETHKGTPSKEALKEWRDINMKAVDEDKTLIEYTKRYRIGEIDTATTPQRVYLGNDEWGNE